MSAVRSRVDVTRLAGMAISLVVVVVAAIYVVVDLARWEWNRAVLSALICIAALIVFSSMLIVGHLTSVERRIERIQQPVLATVHPSEPATSAQEPVVQTRPRFSWLESPERDRGVFVPVLLGAGVVLSFVAYLVERTAAALTRDGIDEAMAARLAAELPLGDGAVLRAAAHEPRRRSRGPVVVGVVVAVLAIGGVVEVLRELTQTRPGEVTAAGVTVVEVAVEQRRIMQPADVVVLDLWGACRSRLGAGANILSLEVLGDDVVRIEIDRSLGETGRRRLVGCFEDHTLDLVRADVVAVQVSTATIDSRP